MTITARIVKAVVTLPVLGTVSRNNKGEVVRSSEKYRIHLYAAKPGMKYESQTHTHLLVGVMDGHGYTSEPVKRSEEVLLPDGREIIALRVDDYGIPLGCESLPVEVSVIDPSFINDALIGLRNEYSLAISNAIREVIKHELKPGGLLHGR